MKRLKGQNLNRPVVDHSVVAEEVEKYVELAIKTGNLSSEKNLADIKAQYAIFLKRVKANFRFYCFLLRHKNFGVHVEART